MSTKKQTKKYTINANSEIFTLMHILTAIGHKQTNKKKYFTTTEILKIIINDFKIEISYENLSKILKKGISPYGILCSRIYPPKEQEWSFVWYSAIKKAE